jgi:hypothetical protein
MPTWTDRPPQQDPSLPYRITRTPATSKLRAVILSTQMIGCPTHYDGRRTVPCEGNQCKLCEAGYAARWHGYVAVWDPAEDERLVLELPAGPAQALADHHDRFHTLRGFDLVAWRPRQKANARIAITLGQVQRPSPAIPAEPDLHTILLRIWGLTPSRNGRSPAKRQRPPETADVVPPADPPTIASTLAELESHRPPRRSCPDAR